MEPIIHVQAHIASDGTLRIEGLHHIADQDVMVFLAAKPRLSVKADGRFDLAQYAAPVTGQAVADKLRAISRDCSSLPLLDDRSADDILGYNDLGLPE